VTDCDGVRGRETERDRDSDGEQEVHTKTEHIIIRCGGEASAGGFIEPTRNCTTATACDAICQRPA